MVAKVPYDFHSRLDEVGRRMATTNRVSVMIVRKGDHLFLKNPLPIGVDVEQINDYGLTQIQSQLQDFVFDASTLRDWSPNLPIEDDVFVWRGRQFQAFSIGDELFTHTTSTRRRIRVHTKQVISKDPFDQKES